MKCINEEKLWEYLDNEVDEQTERQIEQHLEKCSDCQEELDQLMFLNIQFGNAIKAEASAKPTAGSLIEVELSYAEIKPLLKKYWSQITLFTFSTALMTVLFVTLVCPVSGKTLFHPQFQAITYSFSQILYFMVQPLVMTVWMITLTFSFLFWIDKKLLSMSRLTN